jgi:hypothetical protein
MLFKVILKNKYKGQVWWLYYWGDGTRGQPRQKISETSSQPMVVYTCGPSYARGIGRSIVLPGWPQAKNVRTYPKRAVAWLKW